MDYSMTVPCVDCPFRRAGGIRLHKRRVHEIAADMLSSSGRAFPCHKSVDYSDDDGADLRTDKEIHCAGALIFAEKNGIATQMMRIAERFGMYDRNKLMASEAVPEVFDTLSEMARVNRDEQQGPKKRRAKV